MALRASVDFAFTPRAQTAWKISERGLEADVIPVYAGVREYQRGNRIVREFRDPKQVDSPGFRRTLQRMPCMIGHPVDRQGRYIFPSATAPDEGEVCAIDSAIVFYPHKLVQVGTVGDAISDVEIDGLKLPKQRATVTDVRAIGLIKGANGLTPRDEVSIGFIKHNLTQPGVWLAPNGKEYPYDEYQIVDPDDPRVPEEERHLIGAHYLGVGFPRGGSRGEFTRFSVDAKDATPRKGAAPRLFYLVRHGDESGVSGTGHVLDGVIWPDGKVNAAWCARETARSIEQWDTFEGFLEIHVDQHPGNNSEIVFDDGQPPPEKASPAELAENDEPADSPNGEQAMKTAEELMKELEAALARIKALEEELAGYRSKEAEGKAAADKAAKDAAAAEQTKATEAAAKAQATIDGLTKTKTDLEAALVEYRKADLKTTREEIATTAGVDAKDLEIKGADGKTIELPTREQLEAQAMRARFAAGLDAKPDHAFADNEIYLRGLYADLKKAGSKSGVSAGFAEAGKTTPAPRAGADASDKEETRDALSAMP